MPNTFDCANVQCPFFRTIRNRDILCEGITDDCITVIRFKTYSKMRKHCDAYCSDKYKYCEIERMLNAKYDD